ncbi:MAG: hypothetical protein HDS16_07525 [Bacteroides sp.]|nr:hypothetical protein [Bacteroides sp.]MBD5348072.1 hypothetical protein [Bacteroides sp.]
MGKMYFPDETAGITGEFKVVWIEHNVYNGRVKGMKIHTDFSVHNAFYKTGALAVYFYYRNGNAIQDINGRFCASDQQVATHESFFCNKDNKRFSDLVIFMPYNELHVISGSLLDFQLVIWIENVVIARSELYHFSYK